jgi:hypothetical protein
MLRISGFHNFKILFVRLRSRTRMRDILTSSQEGLSSMECMRAIGIAEIKFSIGLNIFHRMQILGMLYY